MGDGRRTIAQAVSGYGLVMSSRFEDEGIPDPGDLEPEQEATGQLELTTEPPHDSPLGVEGWGTTAAEQREGEPLSGRLAREQPEGGYPEEPRDVGRVVEPDEGAHSDTEPDLVASDSGDMAGLSAEEAALHLEP
ncbi:MAG: hypothetical protein QOD70_1087 [Frankiales bacterium]|jgi:hypothetical protein|nr:hypothetical protein [Frankiales bacterium]